MAKIKGLEIKGVTKFKGHGGEPLTQGSIYLNGKRIGDYSDDYTGGEMRVSVKGYDEEIKALYTEYFKEHPEELVVKAYNSEFNMDPSIHGIIYKLLEMKEKEQTYKKLCKAWGVTIVNVIHAPNSSESTWCGYENMGLSNKKKAEEEEKGNKVECITELNYFNIK